MGSMNPNSMYFGLKSSPCIRPYIGTLVPMYVLFGYMDPQGYYMGTVSIPINWVFGRFGLPRQLEGLFGVLGFRPLGAQVRSRGLRV